MIHIKCAHLNVALHYTLYSRDSLSSPSIASMSVHVGDIG